MNKSLQIETKEVNGNIITSIKTPIGWLHISNKVPLKSWDDLDKDAEILAITKDKECPRCKEGSD